MKIAIFGGTFDPVHNAHLRLAQAALAAGMDLVIWMPVARSPFKQDQPLTTAIDRWSMLVLATIGEPRYLVSRCEIERPPPSYTIDTISAIRSRFPVADWWWLIGADQLREMTGWRDSEQLVQLCHFFVVPRGQLVGVNLQHLIDKLPGWLQPALDILAMPPSEISSTEIRRLASQRKRIMDLVPPVVQTYIERYALYLQTTTALC
ncbi:MAG: nicotinate (nicotinamide) nucleotide adenylyltransferase [Cyanobacteria bacterium NC_groundwater_1444_Ag_S-0.65um_54_12]|nr:nicotinate (nicotinamide) nucleotide adenylyltransferase [Cyanobacteria bacterium NC_groundwater_1444_Ag_S-0.65um_54_12]